MDVGTGGTVEELLGEQVDLQKKLLWEASDSRKKKHRHDFETEAPLTKDQKVLAEIQKLLGQQQELQKKLLWEAADSRKVKHALRKEAEVTPSREAMVLDAIENLLKDNLEVQRKILWEAVANRKNQDVIRTAAATPTLNEVQAYVDERQLSFLDTISVIRDEGLSFARFGDGEMKIMLRPDYNLGFQKNSPALASALRSVYTDTSDQVLLGFPYLYRDAHWSGVWCDVWPQVKKLASLQGRVGNSHVSRPVFFQNTGEEGVEAWRSVWADKRVTVITGKGSRFENVPALFDGTKSFDYIYSTPSNAFSDLDRVKAEVASSDADVFLISLGPAGTILANDLAKADRQAIDIGHISDSYTNVFEGGAWPESKPATVDAQVG